MHTRMYWWDLKSLDADLAHGSLSQPQAFKYVLAWTVISMFASGSSNERTSSWMVLPAVAVVALGLLYCYRSNGCADGRDLLARFFSLSWVIGFRTFVAILPVAILLAIVAAEMRGRYRDAGNVEKAAQAETVMYGVLSALSVSATAFIYWRVGVHMAKFHRTTPLVAADNLTAGPSQPATAV